MHTVISGERVKCGRALSHLVNRCNRGDIKKKTFKNLKKRGMKPTAVNDVKFADDPFQDGTNKKKRSPFCLICHCVQDLQSKISIILDEHPSISTASMSNV